LKARPAPQVLSSAVVTPRSRQICASCTSGANSMVTEPGASSQTSLVLGPMRDASAAGSMAS
jgi:hypothetical protein